ncbi:MAG TPA: hypothetical protein PLT91_04250 [Clostridia bacterium]|nr:hypothetical protein [Clostridia bacterium]
MRIIMHAHELMIKTNHYLIKGGQLNEKQKSNYYTKHGDIAGEKHVL